MRREPVCFLRFPVSHIRSALDRNSARIVLIQHRRRCMDRHTF